MKFLFKTFLIAILAYGAELLFPWWSAVVVAAIVAALIPTKGSKAFLSGALAIGLLWLTCALYLSIQADFILTKRVALLFGTESSVVVIIITTFIGALVGGFGALTGNQVRQSLRPDSPYRRSRYSKPY